MAISENMQHTDTRKDRLIRVIKALLRFCMCSVLKTCNLLCTIGYKKSTRNNIWKRNIKLDLQWIRKRTSSLTLAFMQYACQYVFDHDVCAFCAIKSLDDGAFLWLSESAVFENKQTCCYTKLSKLLQLVLICI